MDNFNITVVDDKTNKPIEGMGVMIYSEKIGNASMDTDSDGKVYFEFLMKNLSVFGIEYNRESDYLYMYKD